MRKNESENLCNKCRTIGNRGDVRRATRSHIGPNPAINSYVKSKGDLTVTYDPIRASLFGSADAAFALGFLGDTMPKLDNVYALMLLNQVLKEKGLATVE